MATTVEEAAAHEAGHAVLSLAMGAQLLDITMTEGKDPEALLPGSPDATLQPILFRLAQPTLRPA
jgi:hypothetical protein